MGLQMGGVIINGMNPFPALTAPPTQNAASETQDAVSKAWFEVQWQGNTLDVLILNIQGEGFMKSHFWLLAETEAIARSFLAAVYRVIAYMPVVLPVTVAMLRTTVLMMPDKSTLRTREFPLSATKMLPAESMSTPAGLITRSSKPGAVSTTLVP